MRNFLMDQVCAALSCDSNPVRSGGGRSPFLSLVILHRPIECCVFGSSGALLYDISEENTGYGVDLQRSIRPVYITDMINKR